MSQPYLRPSAPEKLSTIPVLGELFAPLAVAAATGEALTVMLWTSPDGSQLPRHLHQDADEAFFVLEGQLAITAGEDFAVIAQPGDFVFLPKGVGHTHRATGGQVARALQILTPGGVETGLAEVAALAPDELTPQRLAECAARAGLTLLPE